MSREIKNKRSAFRRMTSWEILIFGICGALFPVPYLLSAPWFTVQKNWMLAAAVIPVVVFVIARRFFGKGYWAFLLLFVISFAYVLWRLRYEWGEQFWLMNDRFMGYEEGPDLPDITLFAGFCMVTWAVLIMLMEESLAGHLLMCLSILGIVLMMPTIGLNPDAKVGILPALFAAGFFWLHDQKRRIAGKRTARIPASGKKIHIISLWIIVLVAVSYIAGLRIVGRHAEPLFAFIFDVDSRFDRFLDRYRMAGPTGGADEGSISQANCYPTDHEYLQIYADHKPKQDIYLKGFVGASYSDGTWARADETELYKALSRRFGWEESGTRLSGMFENMYYMQNQKVNKKEEKIALAVKRIRQKNYSFVPYFSRREKVFQNKDGWERDLGENVDVFSYYETKAMYKGLSYDDSTYSQLTVSLHMLENLYLQAVEDEYTEVPDDLSQMRALAEENPKEDLRDITTFILYTLRSRTTYSLTPGFVPVNRDVTEYFLFENGKGYCEHYASAATLLYRLYGIPARYATGYRIPAESFTEAMGGYWVARATGQQSHAWVEIFLKDYGWVPVDVTPGEAGQMRADYPGFENETAAQMLEQEYQNQEVLDPQEHEMPDMEQYLQDLPEMPEIPESESNTQTRRHIDLWKILRWILLIALIPVCIEGQRLLRLKWRKNKSCRRLFGDLTKMLYAAGMQRQKQETEEAFAERAARFLPKADMMQVYRIAEQETFGNRETTYKEKRSVLHAIYLVAEKIRAENLLPKRLWYRWGKAYW